mmetsp:Transcript_29538/g.90572  ORF Transcript_29538/g.90572 Transcript_29538/m.90572 type:complete len:246 (+) Transcript_29538:1691-2428(+)
MQRDDSAHERRGRGKRAKAVQGAQHGRGVLRIELQLRECQRRPRVAPCIGDDGSLAQRRLRIGGPLGTSGQRRRDDSGCLRFRKLGRQRCEHLLPLVRLGHGNREECRVCQEGLTLRGRELLGEGIREVRLALFPRVKDGALAAEGHRVVGDDRRNDGLQLRLEGCKRGVRGGRRLVEPKHLVDVGGLRSEHTKLDLNLLLCELLAREALAAKGERLLKLLFRAREVATADVSARDVVREFKLFR